ncbi:MAG TPA: phosphoribosylglycinamide synthetase C domain-containing protein [Roseiflexaceae bacterium]|nr:phosphoribosylglycinamide synthetase C domain-containing protein [Roseiflexaceae bacterium]
MKILILGDDGRAHALAWKLLNSPLYPEVVCAPGNGGTAPMTLTVDLEVGDVRVVSRWAFDELFDLILPADSRPLHAGLAEEALSLQVGVCGGSQRAAALERSRCQAKEFMLRHRLPTAPGRAFTSLETAERYLAAQPLPVMIKADSPLAGEERFDDRYAALEGLRRIFANKPLEGQSDGVVVESALAGPRVALSAFVDGQAAAPMLAVRLYDRVEESDRGANAPGVGAHTGSSVFAQQLTRYLHERFILPVAAGLAQEGLPFWGILGVDCIITAEGPRLTAIRFSMREGEAQVVLPRLEDDLVPWLQAAIARRLGELPPLRWSATPTVGLGLFARGYPNFFPYGGAVRGLEELDEGVLAFHSATANPGATLRYTPRVNRGGALGSMLGGLMGMGPHGGGVLHTTGGLALTLVTQSATLAGARARALVNADRVQFDGRTYRGDIAAKEFG